MARGGRILQILKVRVVEVWDLEPRCIAISLSYIRASKLLASVDWRVYQGYLGSSARICWLDASQAPNQPSIAPLRIRAKLLNNPSPLRLIALP